MIDPGGWDPSEVAAHLLARLAPGTKWADQVIASLTEVVRSDRVSRRAPAARALGELGPAAETAIPVLLQTLRDDLTRKDDLPYYYGSAAAEALGRIAPGTKSADAARAALIEVLDPPSEVLLATRLAAIEALPAFGASDPRVIPLLRSWQENPDPHIKTAADKALADIEGIGVATPDGDRQKAD